MEKLLNNSNYAKVRGANINVPVQLNYDEIKPKTKKKNDLIEKV